MTDVFDELQAWLDAHWDPDLTVAEWWERLGTAGWSAPSLPEGAYGRGLSRNESVQVAQRISAHGALGAPGGLGLLLAAPTIATHGTPEQIERYVRPIVTGQQAWCQLFSEPGAGSDLAGLDSKAVRDGEEWIVNGQKVWTSGGHIADMGMLIARTNPDAPKHQGITWFAIDMHQEGAVDVRPLREMTGRALFNEVFLTDARVAADAVIGDVNNGWAVANTTLMFERAGLGAGGQGGGTTASAGTIAGDLPRRAGDFVQSRAAVGRVRTGGPGGTDRMLIDMAKANGKIADPTIRQTLMRLYTMGEIGRYTTLRIKAGANVPGAGNIAKLTMSEIVRTARDLGLKIVGPAGTLHAYDHKERKALDAATGNPALAIVTETALFAQGPPIYGGTDQVQRNIIGERVLGLPKEPNNDRVTPWRDLPKNA